VIRSIREMANAIESKCAVSEKPTVGWRGLSAAWPRFGRFAPTLENQGGRWSVLETAHNGPTRNRKVILSTTGREANPVFCCPRLVDRRIISALLYVAAFAIPFVGISGEVAPADTVDSQSPVDLFVRQWKERLG